MKLLMLSTQTCSIKDTTIVWAFDVDTKLLIKAYVDTQKIWGISVGDCVDAQINTNGKRQEVCIQSINKIYSNENDIDDYLEMKAATPYSVRHPAYVGNIVKLEEIVTINNNLVTARLYGFPKELFYLIISDGKWNSYWNSIEVTADSKSKAIECINKRKNKYIIIDFPYDELKGHVAVAALVVR